MPVTLSDLHLTSELPSYLANDIKSAHGVTSMHLVFSPT